MEFRTQISLKKETDKLIDYQSTILLFGSCFSQHIGDKLTHFKFQTLQNPFGIVFHPKAIEQLLQRVINQQLFTPDDVFYHNEQWHCFEVHSSLSNVNKDILLQNLNNTLNSTFNQLQEATHIIITLGTSWVYKHIEDQKIVANCHKIKQVNFRKELLSIDKIRVSFQTIESLIKKIQKKATIIYTVSPVRHIKDGFVQNQQSKAYLISAVHQATKNYFPSYEIMMDELRDYRFYKDDMLHPNQTAIDYIWLRFMHVWIDEKAFSTMKKVDIIQKGLAHRPFNEGSESHQDFLRKIEEKKESLLKDFPSIKF